MLVVGLSQGSDLIKFPVAVEREESGTDVVVTTVNMDGQVLRANVDTSSDVTFFIDKAWYEKESPGGCDKILHKCHECKTPCMKSGTEIVNFEDGSSVRVSITTGKLNLPGMPPIDVDFGLVNRLTGWPQSFAVLGLSAQTGRYVPVINQIMRKPPSERPIKGTAFSFYLRREDPPTGELILGGDDPSLHKRLSYMAVTEPDLYLPPVTFYLQGVNGKDVPIRVEPADYVTVKDKEGASTCYLAMRSSTEGALGFPALRGHYILFNWDQNKIGVGHLK
ncbi:hypothetical protein FOL47_010548 [Perkinsus chesapeaki]|uniref:Peptidase A1 domain-containing protein n=1 Tax=Perkinsus chesapeaki TaxID=330153 RepID=A0A7J6L2P0_PERCH|nr:hypothetical protein FOL47_010548 [Perkinsus chesapeaki]